MKRSALSQPPRRSSGTLQRLRESLPWPEGRPFRILSIDAQPLAEVTYLTAGHHGRRETARLPIVRALVERPLGEELDAIVCTSDLQGIVANEAETTYYLGRQTLLTTGKSRVARWRKMLFSFLARNSRPPTSFFNLPPNRVVELGLQIEL